MMRPLFLLMALTFPAALAIDFGTLIVRPYGEQVHDLTTGITTLPEGGEVIYQEANVTLSGSFVRYHEGNFIEVQEARVEGDFGSFEAEHLRVDMAAQMMEAEGPVRFDTEGLTLEAGSLRAHLEDGIVSASGITSGQLDLEAEAMLIDTTTGQAFLVGPYRYQDGPVTLESDEPGDLLLLEPVVEFRLEASTEIPEGALERIRPYLP